MSDSVSPISTVVLPATTQIATPVRAAEPPPAVSGDSSGNAVPHDGERLPPVAPVSKQSLSAAVDHLNDILRAADRRVRFRIDDASGKTLIFVVDAATGDIVRQIPAEHVVTLGERFGRPGAIVDAHA